MLVAKPTKTLTSLRPVRMEVVLLFLMVDRLACNSKDSTWSVALLGIPRQICQSDKLCTTNQKQIATDKTTSTKHVTTIALSFRG
jgi:hypothetical protein